MSTPDQQTAGQGARVSEYKATVMHSLENGRETICTSMCGFLNHIDRLALPNKKTRKKNCLAAARLQWLGSRVLAMGTRTIRAQCFPGSGGSKSYR